MQPTSRIETKDGPAADDMKTLDGEVRRTRVRHLHLRDELALHALPSFEANEATLAKSPSSSLSVARHECAPAGAGLELSALATASALSIERAPQRPLAFRGGEKSMATAALEAFHTYALETSNVKARGPCKTLLKRWPDLSTRAPVHEAKLMHRILLGNEHGTAKLWVASNPTGSEKPVGPVRGHS